MLDDGTSCVVCGKYVPEGEGMVCRQCQNNPTAIKSSLNNLHIDNSYSVWSINSMTTLIIDECWEKYGDIDADKALNRSWRGMYIEWYLHNIGYWVTLPFIKNNKIKTLNERFKHVDLEEHK